MNTSDYSWFLVPLVGLLLGALTVTVAWNVFRGVIK